MVISLAAAYPRVRQQEPGPAAPMPAPSEEPSFDAALTAAARSDDHAAVRTLLREHLAHLAQENIQACLGIAAAKGHLATVTALLPHTDPSLDYSVALRSAVEAGHLDVCKVLLPRSCPKTLESAPLRAAVAANYTDIALLLLPVSDPLARNSTPFRSAVEHGNLTLVRALLPESYPGANDWESVRQAVQRTQWGALRIILDSFGERVAQVIDGMDTNSKNLQPARALVAAWRARNAAEQALRADNGPSP